MRGEAGRFLDLGPFRMIAAITVLLLCQLAGELLARALHLPVPGPVIGMVLLFCFLLLRGRLKRDGGDEAQAPPPALAKVSDALLSQLGLLFVPAGVGVIALLHTVADNGWTLLLAIGLGTPLTMALTGRLAQAVLRRWG